MNFVHCLHIALVIGKYSDVFWGIFLRRGGGYMGGFPWSGQIWTIWHLSRFTTRRIPYLPDLPDLLNRRSSIYLYLQSWWSYLQHLSFNCVRFSSTFINSSCGRLVKSTTIIYRSRANYPAPWRALCNQLCQVVLKVKLGKYQCSSLCIDIVPVIIIY